jgi:hypothetical protein
MNLFVITRSFKNKIYKSKKLISKKIEFMNIYLQPSSNLLRDQDNEGKLFGFLVLDHIFTDPVSFDKKPH